MIVYVDVLQDYNDHISELANKLVSIMDGVFDLSLSKVSVVSLTSTKRPNLLGNHILCRRFELYVHTHVHACTRQPDLYAFCTCTVLVHSEPTIPRTRELACSMLGVCSGKSKLPCRHCASEVFANRSVNSMKPFATCCLNTKSL